MEIENVNLIIGGMPKCGSYFLYDLLDQHPEINMHSGKEPGYFLNQMPREQYLEGFEKGSYKYRGDGSVGQMIVPEALQKIKAEIKDPKFFILLRDPVKRAISHYHHRVNVGLETRSLSKILATPHDPECYPIYYSRYKKHLGDFFEVFDRRQTMIIIAEDFYADPKKIYQEILQFLELENQEPQLGKATKNTGRVAKYRKLAFISRRLSRYQALKNRLSFALPALRFLRKQVDKLNSQNTKASELIKGEDKDILIRELEPEAIFIQKFMNRPELWKD